VESSCDFLDYLRTTLTYTEGRSDCRAPH
jgi:hypothetical protein